MKVLHHRDGYIGLKYEQKTCFLVISHPANGEDKARPAGADAHEAEAKLPVEPVFADKGDERQSHSGTEHVEDASHVVHIQLAGHHFILLVVADPSQPQGLQLLHFTWMKEI